MAPSTDPSLEPCSAPDTYNFPYQPYPVQQGLMDAVYRTLEEGGVGVLESPTGTGKTLALLAPSLAWLRRREKALLAEALKPEGEEAAEPWAQEHLQAAATAAADGRWQRRERCRRERRARLQQAVVLTADGRRAQRPQKVARAERAAADDLTTFSLEEMPKLPMAREETDLEELAGEQAWEGKLQLIYCSRTHSQLSQVLGEFTRLGAVEEQLAAVTLGSRAHLCINDVVRAKARGHGGHLNDLCRAATERGQAPGGCGLKKRAHVMADACLEESMDLDGMTRRGRAPVDGGCPYYGSRRAVREADLLLVPYASLVSSETRAKLGIHAEGNVLIFDEAHNLLEAISSANSVTVSAAQARCTVDALDAYAAHYHLRLSPGNAVQLCKLQQLCSRLHRYLANIKKSCAQTVGAFLVSLEADHFDLAELSSFLVRTELCRKVRGFYEVASSGSLSTSGAVYGIAELLAALVSSSGSDRVLSQAPIAGEAASVHYLSLDAEARFRDLIASARAVIFAGGTLEPRSEFASLCTSVQGAEQHYTGRHVVPKEHLLARYVTHGPSGLALDFRRDRRELPEQVAALRAVIRAVAAAVPGGAVFFFPCFEYLALISRALGSHVQGRPVFTESRSGAEDFGAAPSGEGLLRNFAAAVHSGGGALLLAVSGAKLSEGINFKDDLCRLVAVVGLPYPNAQDPALLEKMRFLDGQRAKGIPGPTGRDHYAARCMKAVNQCVGRSIRHAGDWAAVLMLDHRYAQANIQGMVSVWLREEAREANFAEVEGELTRFFAARRAPQLCGVCSGAGVPQAGRLGEESTAVAVA